MRLKEAQLKALEEAAEENSAIQESANDSQPCLWPVVVEQVTYPVPSLQAVNQQAQNRGANVSSYQPFNNRKRRRIHSCCHACGSQGHFAIDCTQRVSQQFVQQQRPVKLKSPCYNCGERTHFWRQCNKEDQTTSCPPWRRGPRQREMLIQRQAVHHPPMGPFYRQAECWGQK